MACDAHDAILALNAVFGPKWKHLLGLRKSRFTDLDLIIRK